MKDIMYITSALYLTVNKQQDGVALNVWNKESTFIIRQIILILWIGKIFLIKLRMNKKILRKSI